ncbi:MAG: DUF5808 domain-containing protein [Ferruginibacter sp.]
MAKVSKEQDEIWRNDPQKWKWGLFYYNPDDDRILPPKKNPAMGWTINFANRQSIYLFILILLIQLTLLIALQLLMR